MSGRQQAVIVANAVQCLFKAICAKKPQTVKDIGLYLGHIVNFVKDDKQ